MDHVTEQIEHALQLQRAGQLAEAESLYRQVVLLQPTNADVWQQLGLIAYQSNRHESACDSLARAIRINGAIADYHHNLGMSLRIMGSLKDAETSFRRALQLDPSHFSARGYLWLLLKGTRRSAEAERAFNELRSKPVKVAEDRALWGTILLSVGRFEQGWQELESRFEVPMRSEPRAVPSKKWDGSSLHGRTLLLYGEQGLGDMIQMSRYLSVLEQQGARTTVAIQHELLPLLTTSGYRGLMLKSDHWPVTDLQLGMFSLPWAFGTTLETIPARLPFLRARPDLVEFWRARLSSVSRPRVGLCWQGNRAQPNDRVRSIPLAQFKPLAKTRRVRLISLQKEMDIESPPSLRDELDLLDLGPIDVEHGPFMDTAAIMQNLDLVITVDTAIAHLAGALGVPVWIALSTMPDWRWMFDREDTPWYPTARLFRQTEFGNWSDVFGRMASELERILAASPT